MRSNSLDEAYTYFYQPINSKSGTAGNNLPVLFIIFITFLYRAQKRHVESENLGADHQQVRAKKRQLESKNLEADHQLGQNSNVTADPEPARQSNEKMPAPRLDIANHLDKTIDHVDDATKYALIEERQPEASFVFPVKKYKDSRRKSGFMNRQCRQEWLNKYSTIAYSEVSDGSVLPHMHPLSHAKPVSLKSPLDWPTLSAG